MGHKTKEDQQEEGPVPLVDQLDCNSVREITSISQEEKERSKSEDQLAEEEIDRQYDKFLLMKIRRQDVDAFFEKSITDKKRLLDEKRAKAKHERIKEKWKDTVGEDFFTNDNYRKIVRKSNRQFLKIDWELPETQLLNTELFEQDGLLMLRTALYWGEGESKNIVLPLVEKSKVVRKWKCDLCGTKEWKEKWRYDRHCDSDKHKINTGEIKPEVRKTWRCELCDTPEWTVKQTFDRHCNSNGHKIKTGEIKPEVKKMWRCELCKTEEWEEKWRYDRHRKGKRCLKRQKENDS